MKKKIVNKKTWKITQLTYDDGSKSLNRINNGFTAIELLGIATLSSMEITAIMTDEKSFATIRRVIIERKESKSK